MHDVLRKQRRHIHLLAILELLHYMREPSMFTHETMPELHYNKHIHAHAHTHPLLTQPPHTTQIIVLGHDLQQLLALFKEKGLCIAQCPLQVGNFIQTLVQFPALWCEDCSHHVGIGGGRSD